MIKVYVEQNPRIVMEGSKGFAHFSRELQAYIDNGMISIIRPKEGGDIIEFQRPHTDFKDENGDNFGSLQETVDRLNQIFNTEWSQALTQVDVEVIIEAYLIKKGLLSNII